MAVDIRFYQSLLGVYLFFIAPIQAASDGSNTPDEEMAGWREGPNSRGTLNIVWSCVITIFACTWTVTHLGLPGPNESAFRKFIRRVKWMLINIIFPEFTLSKAICDLRQALDELQQFSEALPGIQDQITWTDEFPNLGSGRPESICRKSVNRERSWAVEYPPCYGLLRGLLRLKNLRSESSAPTQTASDIERGNPNGSQHPEPDSHRHSSNPLSPENSPANSFTSQDIAMVDLNQDANSNPTAGNTPAEAPQPDDQATTSSEGDVALVPVIDQAPQKWTIYHSYYAQMGGILIPSDYSDGLWSYQVLTATKFTSQYQWDKSAQHPLKRLELSERDIQDKSKADWLLKSLAILQITWLVLNVAVREAMRLDITQLEIATVAFALMAVLTYLASWWKPKDISEHTYIRHSCTGEWDRTPEMLQLSLWFKSPGDAARPGECKKLHSGDRVPNDVACMRVNTFSMTLFLAFSSLLFGGIHCRAWNFEFPSRAELMLWRSGCIIAAILPGITLVISTLLSHLTAQRFEKQRIILVEEFGTLPEMPTVWWDHLLNPGVKDLNRHTFQSSSSADRQAVANNWKKRVGRSQNKASARYRGRAFASFLRSFIIIRNYWEQTFADEELDRADLDDWLTACTDLKSKWSSLGVTRQDWNEIEREISGTYGNGILDRRYNVNMSYTKDLLSVIDVVQRRLIEELSLLERVVSGSSRALSITSYLVYSGARLLIMVLLFTSLRSTPADVYEVTPWVNLLPKIS